MYLLCNKSLPASGSQDSLDSTDWLSGLSHQERDVTQLGDGGQEPHVLAGRVGQYQY